jgi:hypothetical protein
MLLKKLPALILVTLFSCCFVGCQQETKTVKPDGDHKHVDGDDHDKEAHADPYHPGHSGFGFVYHNESAVAVGVKLVGDKGMVTLTKKATSDGASFEPTFYAVEEVVVTPPASGKTEQKFSLPATDKNDEGNASTFALEDPALAVAMSGKFTVTFQLEGKEHKYEIFPHGH